MCHESRNDPMVDLGPRRFRSGATVVEMASTHCGNSCSRQVVWLMLDEVTCRYINYNYDYVLCTRLLVRTEALWHYGSHGAGCLLESKARARACFQKKEFRPES